MITPPGLKFPDTSKCCSRGFGTCFGDLENVGQRISRGLLAHLAALLGGKTVALLSYPALGWVISMDFQRSQLNTQAVLVHKPNISLRTQIKYYLGSSYPNMKHAQYVYKQVLPWPGKHQFTSSSPNPRAFLTYPPQIVLHNTIDGNGRLLHPRLPRSHLF